MNGPVNDNIHLFLVDEIYAESSFGFDVGYNPDPTGNRQLGLGANGKDSHAFILGSDIKYYDMISIKRLFPHVKTTDANMMLNNAVKPNANNDMR